MRQRHWILLISAGLVAALLCTVRPGAAQPDAVGQWTSINPMPFVPVHTHTLPTGKVMIWGGVETGGAPGDTGDDPRSWDPATQAVTALSKPGFNVLCSGHAYLGDGSLFIAGGHVQFGVGLKQASKYQPSSNIWSAVPDMNDGRWYPTVTTLANGDALVMGGDMDLTQGVNPLPQVYQAGTGTWRNLTNAQLVLPWYPRMFLAPDGSVFNAGPDTPSRYLNTSGTGAWTGGPALVGGERFYGSAVMYGPGKILTMGGGDPHGVAPPTKSAEVIDLNQPSPVWRAVGSMQFARRQFNAVLLPDGKVLVTGGTSGLGFNDTTSPVYEAELWNPATETWSVMATASVPRLYHSAALLLPDGRVLTTGGDGYTQAEVYQPPYLFKGAPPLITAAPAGVGYGNAFSVQTPDAASVSRVTMVRLPSVTHGFDGNQRFNELSFSTVAGALTVTAPGRPTDAPPGHYMLFILNANGVPSVARIIQLGGPASPPPPSSFTLTVSKKGPGNVASSPPGITCGADCSEAYGAGTIVTLTATPNKNFRFVGWSGACSGTGTCSITMDAAKSLVATFSK